MDGLVNRHIAIRVIQSVSHVGLLVVIIVAHVLIMLSIAVVLAHVKQVLKIKIIKRIFIKEKILLGYYLDVNELCQICHQTCSTCDGPTKNDCLTCSSANHRVIIGKTCNC